MTGRRCPSGKRRHASFALAEMDARRRPIEVGDALIPVPDLYAYRCRACGGWHLTHLSHWAGRANRVAAYAPPEWLQRWARTGDDDLLPAGVQP